MAERVCGRQAGGSSAAGQGGGLQEQCCTWQSRGRGVPTWSQVWMAVSSITAPVEGRYSCQWGVARMWERRNLWGANRSLRDLQQWGGKGDPPPPGGFLPVPEVADEIRVQHPKLPRLQVLPEELLGAVGRWGQLLGAVGHRDVPASPHNDHLLDPLILAAVHRLLAQGRPQQQVVTVVVWEEDVARLLQQRTRQGSGDDSGAVPTALLSPCPTVPHRCLGWVPEAVGSIAVQRVHHSVGGEDVEGCPAANIVLEALRDGPIHPAKGRAGR